MKPWHTTLLLVVVFLGLGSYLYLIELPTIEEEIVQEKEDQQILPFDDRDVVHLMVTSKTETVELQRDSRQRWFIIQPIQGPANNQTVHRLLRAITIGKVKRVLPLEDSTLEDFQLRPPHLTLKLKTHEHEETLLLGTVDPISSGIYTKRGGEDAILLTTLAVSDFRKVSLLTFRQKNIFQFDRLRVTQFRLKHLDTDFLLTQVPSAHGLSGDWAFERPIKGPADTTAINVLLMALDDLEATGFIDPGPQQAQLLTQLTKPTATATISIGQAHSSIQLFLPGPDATEAYAIRSPKDPIYQIDAGFFKNLPKEDFQLLNKRLFGMEVQDIAMMTVTRGQTLYTLIQQHGDWVLGDAPDHILNPQTINLFVSRVVDLPAEFRVKDSNPDMESFGLNNPQVQITGIDKRGRLRGRLKLGTSEKGLVYAMGNGVPGVVKARSNFLSQIPTAEELKKASGD
jgi:hypothetical protein